MKPQEISNEIDRINRQILNINKTEDRRNSSKKLELLRKRKQSLYEKLGSQR